MIVDGSQSPLGLLSAPIRITIQDGRAIKFEGGAEAAQFERHLQSLDDPNAYWVAELEMCIRDSTNVPMTPSIEKELDDASGISIIEIAGPSLSANPNIVAQMCIRDSLTTHSLFRRVIM